MPTDPFLAAALDAVTPTADNVTPALLFSLQQTLDANDPARCYDPQLIRCAAAATVQEQEVALSKLRAKYDPDPNKNVWRKMVKQATAELTTYQTPPTGLICSDNGNPKAVLANAIIQLKSSGIELAYDTFATRMVIQKPSPWGTEGLWRDRDDLEAANYLQHEDILISSAIAHEAADLLAYQCTFHPPRDWLSTLKWDGIPRVDEWMITHLGADDNPYIRAVCAKWTLSAVARIMRPGCKADHVIVLEGAQGKRKSLALRALTNGHIDGDRGVQWFRDSMPDIDSDDIGLYMQGVWIIEIAELEAIRGKAWTKVKSFVSTQVDPFRRKFGRNMGDYPRQCIFAATTNEEVWNGDTTGARRFWPVSIGRVNVDAILRDREQIWAEARFRYDEGETWWLDEASEALAAEQQSSRAPDDPWLEIVASKTALSSEVSAAEVLEKIGQRADPGNSIHVGRIMTQLGWERYRSTSQGRSWRYRRKSSE